MDTSRHIDVGARSTAATPAVCINLNAFDWYVGTRMNHIACVTYVFENEKGLSKDERVAVM